MVNCEPYSDDSWSIRPWQEKAMKSMYDCADFAAWAFQSTFRLSTANVASSSENCSPYSDESWSIRPCREKAMNSRYDSAERIAFVCDGVRLG